MLRRDQEILGRRRCRLCWIKEDENFAENLEAESKKNPDDAELHLKLACAYIKLCKYEESIEASRKAIANGLDDDRGNAQLGRALIESGHFEEGRKASIRAFKINSNNITANLNLAVCNSLSGDYDTAMDYFDISSKLAPYYHRLYGERGLHYARVGLIQEALDDLNKAIEFDPCNHTHYHNISDIYVQNGLINEAEKTLKASIDNKPGCAESFHGLAVICSEKGLKGEAVENIKSALALRPENTDFQKCLERLESDDEAQ